MCVYIYIYVFPFCFLPLVFNLFFKPFVHFSMFSFSSASSFPSSFLLLSSSSFLNLLLFIILSSLPSFLPHPLLFFLILFFIQLSSYTLCSLPSHVCFSFICYLSRNLPSPPNHCTHQLEELGRATTLAFPCRT